MHDMERTIVIDDFGLVSNSNLSSSPSDMAHPFARDDHLADDPTMSSWRLQVLRHWLAGRRNGVGLSELLRVISDPTLGRRARRYIDRMDVDGEFLRIRMHGIERMLYFPRDLDRYVLDLLIVEQFDPRNWHYYQIEPTKLHPDDLVLDCGAAEGLFSLQAESVCKKVFVAEPSSRWLDALRQTFNDSSRTVILPYALSDRDGEVNLSDGLLDSTITGPTPGRSVPCYRIDSLFIEQGRTLTYLKGDLEGAELAVLRGAIETIRACKPRIAITTYHEQDHADRISTFLRDIHHDYRILTKGIEHRFGAPVMLHAWID